MRSVEDRYWWYQALRQHVAASIPPISRHFSLLDAGCGTGGMLDVVRQKFPDADLTGVDASSHAIELATARNLNATLRPANVHDLPFAENNFDFVLSLDVLSHAGVDDSLATHEMHRVLRPGGRLLLNLAAFDFLKGAHDCAVDVDRREVRQAANDRRTSGGTKSRIAGRKVGHDDGIRSFAMGHKVIRGSKSC